jgi:hypothetical protein
MHAEYAWVSSALATGDVTDVMGHVSGGSDRASSEKNKDGKLCARASGNPASKRTCFLLKEKKKEKKKKNVPSPLRGNFLMLRIAAAESGSRR